MGILLTPANIYEQTKIDYKDIKISDTKILRKANKVYIYR